MRLAACVLCLITCSALAGDVPLREFFDPASRAFRMLALTSEEFGKLDEKQKLWARGVEPADYFAPPRYEDAIPQAMNRRSRLHPGFGYRERLMEKQRFWRAASRDASLRDMVELLELVPLEDPVRYQINYGHLTGPLTGGLGAQLDPGQPLRALRHSERMFRRWWFDRIADDIGASRRSQRRAAVRKLVAYLRHKNPEVALGAARVLGGIKDDEARRAVERAVTTRKNTELRTALMTARVRQAGERMRPWIGKLVHDPKPDTARAAVMALREDESPWSLELLESRAPKTHGRLLEDCETEIARRNGTARANLGRVDFYGIKTRSKRILFCIDVSLSMSFPMDGLGGKREPRQRRTVRELTRTLRALPVHISFNVLLFSGTRTQLWRRLKPATEANVAEAIAYVSNLQTLSGTDIYGAAEASLRSGADTAFFLSDGEPSQGVFLDSALLWEEISARNAFTGVRFHCIGLSRDQNSELLYQLARRSGGKFVADR